MVKLLNIVLGADGQDITVLGYLANYGAAIENQTGTSYVAPQIAGAVALLSEHFPNHTAEQISR